MGDEVNVDRDWNFQINLTGVECPTGSGDTYVPEVYCKAVVTDAYINPEKNPSRVVLKLSLRESGGYDGTVRTDGLGVPKGPEDNVRFYWRGLAESAGYGSAQLDAGEIQLSADAFKGKVVHIHYLPKSDDREYENIVYLAPAEWAAQKADFDASAGQRAAAQAAAPTTKAKANPLGGVTQGKALGAAPENGAGNALATAAGNTVSKNDVLATLGLGG